MEAIRELQMYEDEAAKSKSDPALLNDHLDEAVDALELCHRVFPDDLLPRYFLGIALTIQNQRLYAQLLRNRPEMATRAAAAIGPLPEKPWPLLDRAQDCFDNARGDYTGIPELEHSAMLNAANVWMRLGRKEDYDKAVGILKTLTESTAKHQSGAPPPKLTWLRRLESALAAALAGSEPDDEAVGFELNVRILRAAAEHMRALREHASRPRSVADTDTELTHCRNLAANIRDPIARHDVMADALTKRGMVKYFSAVIDKEAFDQGLLAQAEQHLVEALQHKPTWIPARTYLAQVYQAQSRLDKAAEELDAILGKPDTVPDKAAAPPTFNVPE